MVRTMAEGCDNNVQDGAMADVPGVDEQVREIMLGAEFGDEKLHAAMEKELRERLEESQKTGTPLRVYVGYDPSKPDLHLGHSITIRKLRKFQEFGHEVFFLVGTFTAQVGDTSDKLTGRPTLTREAVLEAAKTYAEQAFTILDPTRTNVLYNHEWLGELHADDVFRLASSFTVQQFLARDNYRRRIERGDPVGLHEMLYPLLQGYDAVHLRADVQMGATEQLFNIMAGRRLQELAGQRPAVCITYPVLVGTDGTQRMSKSTGNYIGLSEDPDAQYGKVMSISDDTMRQWLRYITDWSADDVAQRTKQLDDGTLHPMELKRMLAHDVVGMYHDRAAADAAAERFSAVHQRKDLPDDMPELRLDGPDKTIVDVLATVPSVGSRRNARRLVTDGGVEFDGERVGSPDFVVDHDGVLRIGPRRFYKVVAG
jgi:tyrosyl-tRNA synthetase